MLFAGATVRLSAPLPAGAALHPDISMIKVKKAAIPPRHCLFTEYSQAVGCPPCGMPHDGNAALHIAARGSRYDRSLPNAAMGLSLIIGEILSAFKPKRLSCSKLSIFRYASGKLFDAALPRSAFLRAAKHFKKSRARKTDAGQTVFNSVGNISQQSL
ncbi:MAG: hypothetical protein ACLRZH_10730 [Ruthenibacterium lactatiformans]